MFYLLAAGVWAIWLARNDWVFNNKLLNDFSQLPHKSNVVFATMENAGVNEGRERSGGFKGLVACQYPRDRRLKPQAMPDAA